MFVAPGVKPDLGRKLTYEAAQQVARNWWLLLVNGALLVVAGVLIFSIDWTIRELATFIGALFIFQGVADALTTGIDARVRRANVITGLLAVAIFLGAWLIVSGTVSITGAFAARTILPDWWLLLILGLLEIPLGVLALANPGATLAAIITVGGIWAVAVGVMRIVLAFQVKRLPDDVDALWTSPNDGRSTRAGAPDEQRFTSTAS
jgi:uncharacterized membrane protein HdeD (DUF308 family)